MILLILMITYICMKFKYINHCVLSHGAACIITANSTRYSAIANRTIAL